MPNSLGNKNNDLDFQKGPFVKFPTAEIRR